MGNVASKGMKTTEQEKSKIYESNKKRTLATNSEIPSRVTAEIGNTGNAVACLSRWSPA